MNHQSKLLRAAAPRLLLVALFALLGATMLGCGTSSPPAANSPTDDEVTVSVLPYAGVEKLIAEQRGKVVVVDGWSLSCVPCRVEFPHLVQLSRKYSPDQVRCLSMSFDYEGLGKPEEQLAPVMKFLREQKASRVVNVLLSDDADTAYKHLKLAAVPVVYVYDKQGKLRKRFDNEQASTQGAFTYAQVEALVAELLKEPG